MASPETHFLHTLFLILFCVAVSGVHNGEKRKKSSCQDPIVQGICFLKCGKEYNCHGGHCHCLNIDLIKDKQLIHGSSSLDKKIDTVMKALLSMRDTESLESTELTEHPALRHHIAHFCPNLEEARKCINRCMKLGKPAFCGKDHVCYCGHKYGSHDNAKPMDPKDMYAQYRDLYTKYFGPQSGERVKDEEVTHIQEIDLKLSEEDQKSGKGHKDEDKRYLEDENRHDGAGEDKDYAYYADKSEENDDDETEELHKNEGEEHIEDENVENLKDKNEEYHREEIAERHEDEIEEYPGYEEEEPHQNEEENDEV